MRARLCILVHTEESILWRAGCLQKFLSARVQPPVPAPQSSATKPSTAVEHTQIVIVENGRSRTEHAVRNLTKPARVNSLFVSCENGRPSEVSSFGKLAQSQLIFIVQSLLQGWATGKAPVDCFRVGLARIFVFTPCSVSCANEFVHRKVP